MDVGAELGRRIAEVDLARRNWRAASHDSCRQTDNASLCNCRHSVSTGCDGQRCYRGSGRCPHRKQSNTLAERDCRNETPQRAQEGQQLPAASQRSLKTHG
jgi:hypothetical protein